MAITVTNIRVNASPNAWIATLGLGSGADAAKLASIGTAVKISVVIDCEFEIPLGSASAKTEYVNVGLGHGVGVEIPKETKIVDGAGALKAASGDAALHKATMNIAGNDMATVAALQTLENTAGSGYVLLVVPAGATNTSGFYYLIGKVTGSLKIGLAGNSHKPLQLVVNGLDAAVECTTDFTHTLINTAITSITSPGTSVVFHPATAGSTYALEEADIDAEKLLSGKVLKKPGA